LTSSRARTDTRADNWAFEGLYQMLVYPFRVVTDCPKTGLHLDRLLATFRASDPPPLHTYFLIHNQHGRRRYALYRDNERIQRPSHVGSMIEWVVADVTAEAIESADPFLVLHAAAVSWNHLGVVLAAPPDSGKTTLAAGLTRAGFTYMTDEAALIEPTSGVLHPFPRPLAMDLTSVSAVAALRDNLHADHQALTRYQYHVLPEELGATKSAVPCRISLVLAPRYSKAAKTRIDRISPALAVKLLAENSFNFERFGASGLRLLADVVEGAECFRLQVGDLKEAVALVGEVMGAQETAMAST
jgi:hypothetical protein